MGTEVEAGAGCTAGASLGASAGAFATSFVMYSIPGGGGGGDGGEAAFCTIFTAWTSGMGEECCCSLVAPSRSAAHETLMLWLTEFDLLTRY